MHRFSLFPFFFLVTQQTSGRSLKSSLGPVVDLGYAAFAGNTTSPTGVENGPVAFYGNIPYAQPPLEELRFRAPKMLDEHSITSHVDDARGWGPPCIQRPAVVGIGSEDCLKLNIWKPTNVTSTDKLPVAVYIHSPQGFPMYDWVARHTGGIVAVSMAYRLNIFGFLGGATVASDGDLNTGLLDQRAALEWVQRHIRQFGGDPDSVTIYGESAGGASVVIATFGQGTKTIPFKGVTAQSIGFGPTSTQDQVEAAFTSAAVFAGCPTAGKRAMDCLRSASVGALVSAVNRVPNGAFAPVIDGPGGFLPDLPSRLIDSGNFSAVDYIGGHCTGDGKTFASGKPSSFVTDDDIRRLVFSRWPGVEQ
ncbi:hypothetical protein C0995_001373 [Termitomyces sp. Mi166|nr:hypothetical protein C0995_001373 [Termitomyces sp. Mi166\